MRQIQADTGTTASQAISGLKKKLRRGSATAKTLTEPLQTCADAFARNDLERGIILLGRLILQLPEESCDQTANLILHICADRLAEYGSSRPEYLLLALHTMIEGWR